MKPYHFKDREYIWIEVSQDKYRHIVRMADSAQQLADMCGVSKETVMSTAHRVATGERPNGKYERVVIWNTTATDAQKK